MKRFWSKVAVGEPDECWPWTAAMLPNGYGSFGFDGRQHQAHRMAYLLDVGEIPEGHHIHHECETKSCCNPAHLTALAAADHNRLHKRKPDDAPCVTCGGPTRRAGSQGRRRCPTCVSRYNRAYHERTHGQGRPARV